MFVTQAAEAIEAKSKHTHTHIENKKPQQPKKVIIDSGI